LLKWFKVGQAKLKEMTKALNRDKNKATLGLPSAVGMSECQMSRVMWSVP